MHEMSVLNNLMNKVTELNALHGGKRVISMKLRLGALSHFTPQHFREHFDFASRGTVAEGARLELTQMTDETDPDAQGVVLESLEFET
ncbi:MAG: hydrogenase maturation nickel metallochaperone HypA [Myxococcales bacterium]|nr:hydrogenase maturation nickel metallochaperone HypA [Myxococcales bacterium]